MPARPTRASKRPIDEGTDRREIRNATLAVYRVRQMRLFPFGLFSHTQLAIAF